MKEFVFLHPDRETIGQEIESRGRFYDGGVEAFRIKYKSILNACIDARYRQKGFEINYALLDDGIISDAIIAPDRTF